MCLDTGTSNTGCNASAPPTCSPSCTWVNLPEPGKNARASDSGCKCDGLVECCQQSTTAHHWTAELHEGTATTGSANWGSHNDQYIMHCAGPWHSQKHLPCYPCGLPNRTSDAKHQGRGAQARTECRVNLTLSRSLPRQPLLGRGAKLGGASTHINPACSTAK